jgi:hypothetical protein
VTGDLAGREALLIATPHLLALVTGDAAGVGEHVITRLAPWDAVHIGAIEPDPAGSAGTAGHWLPVHIDELTFHAVLSGPAGERALMDFVEVAKAQHEALAAAR